MSMDKRIQEETEKTFQAYDNEAPLQPDPYLYQKLQTSMKSGIRRHSPGSRFELSFRLAVVLLFFIINIATVFFSVGKMKKQSTHEQLVNELRKDFNIELTQDSF